MTAAYFQREGLRPPDNLGIKVEVKRRVDISEKPLIPKLGISSSLTHLMVWTTE
jgi:hypothetical protein